MELSKEVKNRFIKDYKLPISIVEEPNFSYSIEILDSLYNTKEKLNNLKNLISNIGEEEFFKLSSKVINNIIDTISKTSVYETLSNDLLKEYPNKVNVSSRDIYSIQNVGKYFLSFDLVKANFQALKKYSKELVLYAENYEELVSKFTNEKYFMESKQIRQVVFGNLLPKKQQIIQKNIISSVILDLVQNTTLELNDFINATADEFVISRSTKEEIEIICKEIKSYLEKENYDGYRLETFKLNNIDDRKLFVKEYLNGKIEFKGIPSFHFLQVYKKYFDLPLDEKDLQFIHEGELSTFLKPLFEKEFNLNLELNSI